jgi:FkbM family methyltransferase
MAIGSSPARSVIKRLLKDTPFEPAARWLVKRSRGIPMPLDLVKNEIYDRQAEEAMTRVLRAHSNCVDAGAHEGAFLRVFLARAPGGTHFAFEPIPELAASLRDRFDTVRVFELALSDKAGNASFYVFPQSPALSGLSSRTFIRSDENRREIVVRTERLDALLPAALKIDLIKIDVEGAEGTVIAGAIETISRDRPHVIFEHGETSSMAFGFSSKQIFDLLVERCGLRISLLPAWLAGRGSLTRQEFANQRDWYFIAHPPT